MNTEAQQAVIDLEGDGVAPGCQVLLPQQRGQAREDLLQGSSRGISIALQRPPIIATASGRAPSTTLQQQPRPQLSADPRVELARLAASWLLTHRRAEVELLQACEDTIPMKAFDVSENFFMSTGLGTLPGEGGMSAVRGAGSWWQSHREPHPQPALVGSFPQPGKADSTSPFSMMGPGSSPHSFASRSPL